MQKKLSIVARVIVERKLGTIQRIEPLSHTNNIVCCVTTSQGQYVVKEIVDPTVDAFQEKQILNNFPRENWFRPILHVQLLASRGASLVIAPYVKGESFDKVLSRGSYSLEQANFWAKDLNRMFCRLKTIPVEGFGRPRNHRAPSFRSWTAFLNWYLESQRKKGPRLAEMRYQRLRRVFERLVLSLDDQVRTPTLVAADVNARNFLVVQLDNRLQMIHMPVIWHGDPALPYGEMMIHLHDTSVASKLLELVDYPMWRIHFYAAFSAYVILAFAERFVSTPLNKVTPWGGRRTLLQLLDEHLDML